MGLIGWVIVALLSALPAAGQAPTLEEANELLERERWSRAVSSFRWITREQPGNSEAWIGLIEALRGKGDLNGALEAARQAEQLPSVAARASFLRGCLLAQQGDTEGALAALGQAVRNGFSDREAMRSEPALSALLSDERLLLPQGREVRGLDLDGETIRYLFAEPPGLRPGRQYPVLIALGPGRQDLEAAEFLMAHFVGEQAVQRGWVVAAPEAPPGGWAGPTGVPTFEALLEELGRQVAIAGGRVHLVGAGNGAYSAFGLAQAVPDRITALVALSGAPAPGPGLTALEGVRVLQLVGEMDGTWIAAVQAMHEALAEAGVDAELDVIGGERHFLESLAGDGLMLRIDEHREP